jgi:hypothetical protein
MTYWFYFTSLASRHKTTEEDRKLQLARVVLNRLAAEIRQATMITADNRVGLHGEEERIWLSTFRTPPRDDRRRSKVDPLPPESDLIKVEYKIARHPDILDENGHEKSLGLARVEIRVPRPNSLEAGQAEENKETFTTGATDEELLGPFNANDNVDEELGTETPITDEELIEEEESDKDPDLGPDVDWEELYAPEIKFLRFCYYDGYKWWDTWQVQGTENPLPQLVMVTVGFEGHAPCGEGLGITWNEEFCDCMNNDPEDCKPLARDQLVTMIRVIQADQFFRSRVTRETQALVEELTAPQGDETEGESK